MEDKIEEGKSFDKINLLLESYKSSKDKYSRFAKSISQLLKQLLKSSNVKFQQVTFREKDREKLKEKYQRKPDLVNEPLEKVYDLAGCRVIFYLEEQIDPFIEILKREFKFIDSPEKKWNPSGYNATHVIIKLDDRRSNLAEYSEFSNLICEIQLTTVLFHAWSEINHDIIYKKEEGTEKFSKGDMKFIEEKLKEIMQNYIQKANYNLSFVVSLHERLKKGMQILNTNTMKSLAASDSNEEILNYILKLNNFSGLYRLPPEFNFLKILDTLLIKALENNSTSGLTIIDASFDFLKNIVYWDYLKIIQFCIDRIDKTEYKENCKKVLLEISKYNLNVVKMIGYNPQSVLIEKIMPLKTKGLFNEFLIEICKHLLATSLEGNSQNEFNTFTFTQGPIYINKDLKKIRKDAIDLLFSLIDAKTNCKFNQSIMGVLFSSIKIHHQNIRVEDLDFLRSNAKSILSKIISDYASIKNCTKREIESELKYPSKPVFEGIDEVNKLIELINKDQEYQKYRAFVGYETDYGSDWKTVEINRKNLLDKFVSEIVDNEVDDWIQYLKNILGDYDKKDYGLFQNLHYFLNELGKKKPKIGDKFKPIAELEKFRVSLLCGLLESEDKKQHHQQITEWIKKNERLLDIAITFRFITDYENTTFSDLVKACLNKGEINELVELLLTICKNYKIKKSTKEQFLQIIQKLTELKAYYWSQWVSYCSDEIINDLSTIEYEIVLENMRYKNQIEYEDEKIMLPLVEKNPARIIDFFYERVKLSKSGTNLIDSIPYSFQLIRESLIKKVEIVVPKILEWLKEDDWKYKWEAGHILNIIFPTIDDKLKEILITIIKEKDSDKLEQIFWILDKYKGTADVLNILYEIIKSFKITNKIRNRLFSILSHTGVVTGEYGIVEAYKVKIRNIEAWLSDARPEIVEFAKGYTNYLENAIKYETARVEKELDLMKSEFDRSKKL